MADACLSVLVVDDLAPFRDAVRAIFGLDEGVEVVGEAASVPETLAWLETGVVDIVLMDVEMPPIDGIRGARMIRELPEPPLVMLCSVKKREELPAALEAPGVGFVLKDDLEPQVLLDFWARNRRGS